MSYRTLTRADAERLKAAIRVEYNDVNATPCRDWDYLARVDGMEEEFATTWGRTPEAARADMEALLDDLVEEN